MKLYINTSISLLFIIIVLSFIYFFFPQFFLHFLFYSKTISNIAINPKGREELQEAVETLNMYAKIQDLLIAESAKEAIVRVTWIP